MHLAVRAWLRVVPALTGCGTLPCTVLQMQSTNARKNLPAGPFWLDQGEPLHAQLLQLPAVAAAAAAAAAAGSGAPRAPASGADVGATSLLSRQSSRASGERSLWLCLVLCGCVHRDLRTVCGRF